MSIRNCCRCGSPAIGKLDSIGVTLLCLHCCREQSQSKSHIFGCFYIVSEHEAIAEWHVGEKELKSLRHLKLVRLGDGGSAVTRFYLRGEVRHLRSLALVEELKRDEGIDLKEMDSKTCDLLLGRYRTEISHNDLSIDRVLARYRVLNRVKETLQRCPWEYSESVFEFFLESPNARPDDFEHMKRSMAAVFEIEGERILHGIPERARPILKYTPLADVYDSFEKRDSDAMLRGYLAHWFGKDIVERIMQEPGWRSQSWARGPEDRVALVLKYFWEGRTRRRRALLTYALTKRGVTLAEDSDMYVRFVNGESTYSVREIVALADLRHQLEMQHGIDIDSVQGDSATQAMLCQLNAHKAGHARSVKRGVRAALEHRC